MQYLKLRLLFFTTVAIFAFTLCATAQKYKTYKLSAKGDTLNAITQDGLKQGKWVMRVEEIRGEPGYEEEGLYHKGQKEGLWRRYNLTGDLISVENFLRGSKDGLQQYFTYLGDLEREENWRGYNPDSPYDTIPIYGTGSGEIIDYKIVKAEPYSVKHGEWKYYEPGTGRLIKKEEYDRNLLVVPKPKETATAAATPTKKKEAPKTAEMLEWEKKNKGKKRVMRDGKTGL